MKPRWPTHTLNAFCFADHGHREREHDDPEYERQAAVVQLQAQGERLGGRGVFSSFSPPCIQLASSNNKNSKGTPPALACTKSNRFNTVNVHQRAA
jgi:hypothetical protein